MPEFALIERIRELCALTRADVRLGIGDDAAIVAPPADHELVICTDTLVAGVHFPHATAPHDLGWKSLAVNLSDLAAMGATPAWTLLALTLPDADIAFVDGFARGFAELAALHRVALIGGDTTRGPLAINVSMHGFVPRDRALRRSGAEVGDAVLVTGTLGDAAAGLLCSDRRNVSAHARLDEKPDARTFLLERLHRPTPRIAAGLVLRDLASACIDVSDGLLADLGHVARQSGVGIDIDASALPASPALLGSFDGSERVALQAAGGDDYELAFTASATNAQSALRDLSRVGCGVGKIGRVVAGSGVRLLDADGAELIVARAGWEHFS